MLLTLAPIGCIIQTNFQVGDEKMLDFIVLGIVPGTSLIITLSWVLLIALVISLYMLVRIELKKPRKTTPAHSPTNLETVSQS